MVDSERLSDLTLPRRDVIRGGAALGTLALASRIGAYAQVVEAQITEPRIQLGGDYAIHDSGGDLVINHDPNGDILYYDASADQITTLKPLTSVTTVDLGFTGKIQNPDDTAGNFLKHQTVTLDDTNNTELLPGLSTNQKAGFLIARETANVATFQIQGGENAVTKIDDPDGAFTTTEDNQVTINIYWDGSQYVIENERGNTRTISVWFFR